MMRWLFDLLYGARTVGDVIPYEYCNQCGRKLVWRDMKDGFDPITGVQQWRREKWCTGFSLRHDCGV